MPSLLLADGQVYVAQSQTHRERQRGEARRIALSHAVISQDVPGLAALLDSAKLHSNDSERAAKYLLGLN